MLVAMTQDGRELKEGDEIVSFRDETWIFINVLRDGKIYAHKKGSQFHQSLFPSVFKLEVIEK